LIVNSIVLFTSGGDVISFMVNSGTDGFGYVGGVGVGVGFEVIGVEVGIGV
jgi:hypothetical protein